MNLFHTPWLHQLPEPTGHFSGGPPRRFGSRRRNPGATDDSGPAGDGDGAVPGNPFGTAGW